MAKRNQNDMNYTCKTFTGHSRENIAFLQLHKHFLLQTENLLDRDQTLEFLDRVCLTPSIKMLIFAGAPDAKGRDEFFSFFKNFFDRGMDITLIHRMLNFIDQLVLKLAQLKKYTIYINSGHVLATYLNIGLACDYRILSDKAVLQNPGIEMGLAATGGGAYFLPRLIGPEQAREVMLSDRDISAAEAMKMGLIHKTIPPEALEEAAFRQAEKYMQKPDRALSLVKELMSFSTRDLQSYLELEDRLLINIIQNRMFEMQIDQP